MTLQGQALRAKRIGTGIDPAIRQKFPVGTVANRAFDSVTEVGQSEDLHPSGSHPLQIFPRYMPDYQRNQFFHFRAKITGQSKEPEIWFDAVYKKFANG